MIVIIDYGLGNLASVKNALDKLGIANRISSDPALIKKAKALILPGVGAAGAGMAELKKRGLDKLIIEQIKKGKPFLGICLGMQLLFDKSEERNVACLGVLKGTVKKFQKERKVPQIGWNQVAPDKSYFYFVNSYYCAPSDPSIIVGQTTYGETFASVVRKDNIVGVQFHPEKSGEKGLLFLKNFWEEVC